MQPKYCTFMSQYKIYLYLKSSIYHYITNVKKIVVRMIKRDRNIFMMLPKKIHINAALLKFYSSRNPEINFFF